MTLPNINSEMTQLIDQLNQTHLLQKQQIADSFHDGLILFSLTFEPLLINHKARDYLQKQTSQTDLFKQLKTYRQKRNNVLFDLQAWLQQQSIATDEQTTNTSPLLWVESCAASSEKDACVPVLFKIYPIKSSENQIEKLLVLIIDQTLQIKAQAQLRLMEASYAGQFITDSHGYITQPNYAFCAYTNLNPTTLQAMTYIDWLKQQVVLRVPFGVVMEALLKEGQWSGEVQLSPSPQAQYHAVLNLSMLTDDQRNIEHFIGVLQDITDIQEARYEIERLAYYDNLTGLANRTLLHNKIATTLDNYQDTHSYSAIILLDLDGFKIINDTLGHSIGDQLLILVAQKLTALAGADALVARLDSDEFAILISDISQDPTEALTQALNLAYRIKEDLDDRYTIQNRSLHCTASTGVYLFSQPPADGHSDALIRYANLAMHEAKNLGGNQVYQFEEKLCLVAKQRLEMLQALNHSELDNEFQLYFQVQIDASGQAVGAETLLRWFHPTLGLVPPAEFIPVAEEGRQIIKIGLWVMHKAFLQAKSWNERYGQLRVSINISPIQFHEQSFVELVIGLVKFTQVNPAYITLELTEGVLIRNTTLALQKIQHLVSLGFKVSIDDFGTGYSSLSYLQKLPIHELKIDQSFIRHIPEEADDVAIVDSILKLAQTKGLSVVAEGVETMAQAQFLRQRDSNLLIQGYLYSKPVPADLLETQFLSKRSPTNLVNVS